jgi:exonuclease SbcC
LIIRKIELENIRSHRSSIVEFDRGITVFTGRTGCGKSTILMAIEYALFGSEGGVSNNAILRRGSQSGKIVLDFEEQGETYTVTRGLKRSGKTIVVDVSNSQIFCNGTEIPLLGRATDINKKMLEIINYPEDIKPKDLFETTSYTRQDEIRALIQMSTEKRQEHIDKILQLSKYRDTWDNMKDVISFFENELSEKKVRLERLESLQKEVLRLEKRVIETKTTIEQNKEKMTSAKTDYDKLSKEVESLESEIRALLEKRRKLDQLKGIINNLKQDITSAGLVITAFEERVSEMKKYIADIGHVRNFDMLQLRNVEILTGIESKEKKLKETRLEFENIKNLGEGKCPVCLQNVTSEHLSSLKKEFDSIRKNVENEIKVLQEEQRLLEPEMRKSRKLEDLKKDLEKNLDKQGEKKNLKKEKEIELHSKLIELEKISIDDRGLNEKEFLLSQLKEQEKEVFSRFRSLQTLDSNLGEQLEYSVKEFDEKKKQVDELEGSKGPIQKLEAGIDTLNRLREDIRNIREVIRRNFLEDFRQEFQKKFEEIRRYEEEYSVDIKPDYEPVAFTSDGEEVPITNLSGGEKTSVALSYRLALADLAAQISSINPSEILILDEPTTGFDQEDIKALPPALRNIKTIPQIIIVTHEEELKNAADYKLEIRKESRESIITQSD